MKILLLGEYSNMHWTLAEALRFLGHEVCVVSDGDSFKSYSRDITISRNGYGYINTLKYVSEIWQNFRKFKGYDVVQIINPCFLDLKPKRNLQLFHYLKRHNKKVFLGAFGDDYFWMKTCLDAQEFRYSEFDIPGKTELLPLAKERVSSWIGTDKEYINRTIADECNGIIACLYEYYKSYDKEYKDKLTYIAEPINLSQFTFKQRPINSDVVNFFIGIQKTRSPLKGTDVMLKVLKDVQQKYKHEANIKIAENIPYSEYITMRNESDILLDQLHSYTPAMNALGAMAQGMVAVSGGEKEYYDFIGEKDNHPIINVYPSESDIFEKLENLVINKEYISDLSVKSRLFVEKHHDHINVAREYLDFWTKSN